MTTPGRTAFIVVGDLMVDTLARAKQPIEWGVDQPALVAREVGGQAANTSAWLAWLNTTVSCVACRGNDPDGEWASRSLENRGVRTFFETRDGPTGVCAVIVAPDGIRTMFSDVGANQYISDVMDESWERILRSHVGPQHVHLSGYLLDRDSKLPSALLSTARALSAHVTTSLDTAAVAATDDHLEGLRDALPHLDVLIGTVDEIAALAGLAAHRAIVHEERLIEASRNTLGFTGTLVLKRGARGAMGDDGHSRLVCPAHVTHLVDTTGAGDAFSAGFLAAWCSDRGDLASALSSGTHAAAMAIAQLGAGPPTTKGR